jgi:hypothetical protein
MRSTTRPADTDTTRLNEILRGASRGHRDPDLELFSMLVDLGESEYEAALDASLERLARDADPD